MTAADPGADLAAMLTALRESVEAARAMPLSASCVINRAETLAAIDEISSALPERLAAADALLAQGAAVLTAAGEEAEALLADTELEAERRLAASEDGAAASAWASAVREQAEAEVAATRAEAEEFVDHRLAHVEAALEKTLSLIRVNPGPGAVTVAEIESRLAELSGEIEQMLIGVRRGREQMHGRHHMEDLGEHLRALDDAGTDPDAGRLGSREELG
jgi:hypothetical protein